jgi:uncharacterized protein with PQ loop repeat
VNFIEFQNWGLNALTVGAIGTIIFTFVETWGLWQQNKTIWKFESGQSISIVYFAYATGVFMSVLIYGIAEHSLAMIINGFFLTLFHLPILIGLWKFESFSTWDKRICVGIIAYMILMSLVPFKDILFMIFSFTNVLFTCTQPWKIWREKDAGAVEIKLIFTYLANTFFWIAYAYTIHDWVLQIICPCYFVLSALIIVLWFKYRNPAFRS